MLSSTIWSGAMVSDHCQLWTKLPTRTLNKAGDLNAILAPRRCASGLDICPVAQTAQTMCHTKVLSDTVMVHLQSFLSQLQCVLCDLITGHIGSHDEDGILAIDSLPFSICQPALGKNSDCTVREV